MTHHQITDETKPPHTSTPKLTLRFSSTRRGARLARQLAVQQLTEWTGLPHGGDPAHTVALVTAELASNAIRHGSLPGRDFRLGLLLLPCALRIELTDTRPERHPGPSSTAPQSLDAPSGRGLLLVEAYTERWGWECRDAYTKTVWGEVALPSPPEAQAAANSAKESLVNSVHEEDTVLVPVARVPLGEHSPGVPCEDPCSTTVSCRLP
ncbi:ATP-binding protein [Streptomyces mirabilis]|uniref:ATP-binding protein n=1 Tax=Streptomyces mirabilis TaxID=68239 RepID=UPI003406F0BA